MAFEKFVAKWNDLLGIGLLSSSLLLLALTEVFTPVAKEISCGWLVFIMIVIFFTDYLNRKEKLMSKG